MKRFLAVAAMACALAAPGLVRADDGLPPPELKKTDLGAGFRSVVFKTGGSTLTVQPNGDFTVDYPKGVLSQALDALGFGSLTRVTGHATPAELAAIDGLFGSSEARKGLGYEGPIWDSQVLSKKPFSIDVVTQGDIEHFDDKGTPTGHYNLASAGAFLGGMVDRVTDGYVYGGAAKTIQGTVAYAKTANGDPRVTVTDDAGHVYLLTGSAALPSQGIGAPISLLGYGGYGATTSGPAAGTRVSVRGVVSQQAGDTSTLVLTEPLESVPTTAPAPVVTTPGIIEAVKAK
jgi:hypothetical protein